MRMEVLLGLHIAGGAGGGSPVMPQGRITAPVPDTGLQKLCSRRAARPRRGPEDGTPPEALAPYRELEMEIVTA
jgi:hypothetical protein